MSACGSEPHSSSAVWQYMLKIDASFGERKNGIRTQDLLNTSQTLLALLSPPLESAQKSQSKSVYTYTEQHRFYTVYKWKFPVGSTMPERILSLPTTTASGNILSQRIVAHYTTNRHQVLVNAAVAWSCSQFCESRIKYFVYRIALSTIQKIEFHTHPGTLHKKKPLDQTHSNNFTQKNTKH